MRIRPIARRRNNVSGKGTPLDKAWGSRPQTDFSVGERVPWKLVVVPRYRGIASNADTPERSGSYGIARFTLAFASFFSASTTLFFPPFVVAKYKWRHNGRELDDSNWISIEPFETSRCLIRIFMIKGTIRIERRDYLSFLGYEKFSTRPCARKLACNRVTRQIPISFAN